VIVHVDTVPKRTAPAGCIFRIDAPLKEGGRTSTCLTSVEGFPSPLATMHSKGVMTFVLAAGAIRVRVAITQTFARDGEHATQTISGRVIGGTKRYAHAKGTLRGGGTVLDRRASLGRVRLTYRLALS
jgi:hypothetical protein